MDEYTYTKRTLKQEEARTWSVFSLLSIKFDGEPFQFDKNLRVPQKEATPWSSWATKSIPAEIISMEVTVSYLFRH